MIFARDESAGLVELFPTGVHGERQTMSDHPPRPTQGEAEILDAFFRY